MTDTDRMVRLAESRDAAVVAALLHDFNIEFETRTPGVEVLAGRVETLLGSSGTIALIAGEPVTGLALLTLRSNVWYDGPVALLDELYVRPHLRGRGIGTALLERACAVVREHGGQLFEINVDEVDTDARRFYERHGFVNQLPGETGRMLYYEREL
jgi:GNAT superfamily N-acetyltransferase